MLLLLGMSVLCLALFSTSLIGDIEPNALRNTIEASRYAKSLAKKWEGGTLAEISKLSKAESARLNNYDWWLRGYFMAADYFVDINEANASISDLEYLVGLSENLEEYDRAYSAFSKWRRYLDDEISYLNGYEDYLAGVQLQAERQSQTGVFGTGSGFPRKNLLKTAEDFRRLDGVVIEFGNNIGIERWLEFKTADYFFLAAIAVFALAFLEERKKGLWSTVRCCKNGRARLGLTRIGILCAASALCTFLIYGLTLIVSLALCGGFDGIGRSLQSLESFRTCTLNTTVAVWLIEYFLLKIAAGILIGLLIWCVLGMIANIQFSLSVLGVTLAAEYALYRFLPVQSFMNIAKYVNIFSYVHLSDLYTQYFNVNIFGEPVGIRFLMLSVLPLAVTLLSVCAVLIQSKRYPEGNRDILTRLSNLLNRVLDVIRTRLSIGWWEVYKTLFYGFGVFIIAGILLISPKLSYIVTPVESDRWYQAYLSDMEGMIDEGSANYFERARASAGEGTDMSSAIDRLEADVKDITVRAEAGGYTPWLVDGKVYESVYGPASLGRQRFNAAAALVFLVFCCAGIMAYEWQSGMVTLLRSTSGGRSTLIARKTLIAAAMAVFVWSAVYMRELVAFLKEKSPATLMAPVQNIAALTDFPLKINFAQYLALLYAVRLAMLILVAFAILLISKLSPNVQTAYVLSIGIIGLPAFLVLFGADTLKYISPIVPVSSAEIMWRLGNGDHAVLIPWTVMISAGLSALLIYRRKWLGRVKSCA